MPCIPVPPWIPGRADLRRGAWCPPLAEEPEIRDGFKMQSMECASGHAFKIDLGAAELRLVPAGDPSARRTVEQIVAPVPLLLRSMPASSTGAMGLAVDEDELWPQANSGAGALSSLTARSDASCSMPTFRTSSPIASSSRASPVSLLGGKSSSSNPRSPSGPACAPREMSSFSSCRRKPLLQRADQVIE
jgi:hypothetical protein